MGNGGVNPASGRYFRHVAVKVWMAYQGYDYLHPERGKFYVDDGSEVLVRCGVLHNTQQPAGGEQGGTILGTMPRANVDPTGGRPEH